MPARLNKSGILRGRNVFHRLFTEGKTLSAGSIRCFYAVEETPTGGIQAGFTVTRNAKNAVARNRIKRLMKESWRRRQHELAGPKNGLRIAFLYYKYSGGKKLQLEEVDGMMHQLLAKLNKTLS